MTAPATDFSPPGRELPVSNESSPEGLINSSSSGQPEIKRIRLDVALNAIVPIPVDDEELIEGAASEAGSQPGASSSTTSQRVLMLQTQARLERLRANAEALCANAALREVAAAEAEMKLQEAIETSSTRARSRASGSGAQPSNPSGQKLRVALSCDFADLLTPTPTSSGRSVPLPSAVRI